MEVIERIKEIPRWGKWLGMVAVATAIGLLDYTLYFSPKYEQVRLMQNNVRNLESQLRIIRNAAKDYQTLAKRIKEMRQTLKELENSFPNERGSLLSFLATINTDLVSINGVKEGKVVEEKYYREKEYEVNAVGEYRKVVKWLKQTLKKSRALSIKELDFKKGKDGNVNVDVIFSYVSVKRGT